MVLVEKPDIVHAGVDLFLVTITKITTKSKMHLFYQKKHI